MIAFVCMIFLFFFTTLKCVYINIYINDLLILNLYLTFLLVTLNNLNNLKQHYIYIYTNTHTHTHTHTHTQIYIYIYISKMRHLFLNELYFGFFQTLKPLIGSSKVWRKPKYNSFRNKCLIIDIYIYIYIYILTFL